MVDSNQRVVSRKRGQYGAGLVVLSLQKKWWLLPGSNQRPVDYDSIALPTELSSQPEVVKIKWLRQQDSNLRQGG